MPYRWASYLLTARERGVSQCQFNQPEDWFAELYAAYYMGKLPEAHPDRGWFTRDVYKAWRSKGDAPGPRRSRVLVDRPRR